MPVEETKLRSRRALLAGATAGAAVLAAEQLARPLAMRAADGDAVLVGHSYEATAPTAIANNDTDADVLNIASIHGMGIKATSVNGPAIGCYSEDACAVIGASEHWIAVQGESFGTGDEPGIGVQGNGPGCGVMGLSHDGVGVSGSSQTAEGVYAASESGTGLVAASKSTKGSPAIYADHENGDAIVGSSKDGAGLRGQGREGVHGDGDNAGVFGGSATGNGVHGRSVEAWGVSGASEATQFGAGGGVFGMSDKTVGVFGLSAKGIAVEGRSDHDPATGIGVKGYSRQGIGVHGESDQGTAVQATAVTPAATALRVEGRVAFQTAGLATIASRARSATVNPGVPLTATTKVLVTLMSDPGLRALQYVAVNPTAGTFTVHLAGLATRTPISLAWFVIE